MPGGDHRRSGFPLRAAAQSQTTRLGGDLPQPLLASFTLSRGVPVGVRGGELVGLDELDGP
eukprot:scaffold25518_cov74-Phaeocystis_antarctica.AAC.2